MHIRNVSSPFAELFDHYEHIYQNNTVDTFSLFINRILSIEYYQSNIINRILPVECYQSNIASRMLSIEYCQSNIINRILSIEYCQSNIINWIFSTEYYQSNVINRILSNQIRCYLYFILAKNYSQKINEQLILVQNMPFCPWNWRIGCHENLKWLTDDSAIISMMSEMLF